MGLWLGEPGGRGNGERWQDLAIALGRDTAPGPGPWGGLSWHGNVSFGSQTGHPGASLSIFPTFPKVPFGLTAAPEWHMGVAKVP